MPITKATPNVISPISTTNLANSIVLRDASGNFSAGTITAALSGNATTATTATTAGSCTGNSATATTLQTARTIALTGSVTGSASFDGSANISIATTGGGGGVTSAKAWVNFNGTNQTIRSSYNISSITKALYSYYTVSFTTALADANYSVVGVCSGVLGNTLGGGPGIVAPDTSTGYSTASIKFLTMDNNTDGAVDFPMVSLQIFGN